MIEDPKQNVDPSDVQFKKGVEAGLNSAKDTKNWKAGNLLGQELKDEAENTEPAPALPRAADRSSTPLFVSLSTQGNQGNAQDEKDETEE
ncbi:MAG TPA: hypothetical protein VEW46_11585 [Pyrinomonadaceae bacterium]|nr:hypothetical protein [Pyrinomonadaceae bacterium]